MWLLLVIVVMVRLVRKMIDRKKEWVKWKFGMVGFFKGLNRG